MAHSTFTPSFSPPLYLPNPKQTTKICNLIRCGPRGSRGPLVKGRILSTEAIQAIQSLKRAHRLNPTTTTTNYFPFISRLLKADLLATLRELLRQDECKLALYVLSALQSEFPPVDLNLYADFVNALARNRLLEEIDLLIDGIEVIDGEDDEKGLLRLIKGVVEAGRKESTVKIYGLMKESGFGSNTWMGDEYLVKVLSKGLRRLGEGELADEVKRENGGDSRVYSGDEEFKVRPVGKGSGSRASRHYRLLEDHRVWLVGTLLAKGPSFKAEGASSGHGCSFVAAASS